MSDEAFTQLEKELLLYLPPEETAKVRAAYLFALKAHEGQKRSSGEDYISHPIEVARVLANIHLDPPTLMAALLHDVLEDTPIQKQDLEERFGSEIADLVDGVSKLTQIKFGSRAEAQAENFRKMLLAMVKDLRVILIKLADRLHNMRTVHHLPLERRQRIARETLEIHAPIANRLGMHSFFVEFEELGFAALYPMRYRILKKAVKKARGNRKEIINDIQNSLKNALAPLDFSVVNILGREKHLYSIYKKMRHKHMSLNEIMDIYAFRIIVDSVDNCYRTLGAVHNLYKPISERFKDYIAIPKSNGYQALHTSLFGPYGVPIEIQIRTVQMDHIAETGFASHWLYKTKHESREASQRYAREWLKGLIEMQQSTGNSLEFIENVKIDLFPDEVYIFTPKGEIIKLPRQATVVDFAYYVHSDIGDSCIAAKINRRLAPLSTVLSSGQTVEIITAPGTGPNPNWLSFVVTAKARSRIRHYLKTRKRSESIVLGQRLLEKALNSISKSLDDIDRTQLQKVLKESKLKKLDDLFESTGIGNQLPLLLAKRLTGTSINDEKSQEESTQKSSQKPLLIKGSEGVVVHFAECCRPIPGDPIIAVFAEGRGISVHIDQCQKLERYANEQDRLIHVSWEENVSGEFLVDILVEVENQRGNLANLTAIIARLESNIADIHVREKVGNYCQIEFTISVQNRIHLARILKKLRATKTVSRIYRNRADRLTKLKRSPYDS